MDDVTPVIELTEQARDLVSGARADEAEADTLALWIAVSGASAASYTYDMFFRKLDDAEPGDVVQCHDDLSVVVPADSVEKLRGATLDVAGGGMVMRNPNRPPASPAVGAAPPAHGEVSGPVAERVVMVLEEHINPAIASHGGRADLVAVEEEVVYLRLSGGCQGCGLASMTLSQGIEVAILEAVPEITRVVDVTDHASGTNPFYEPAKK